MLHLDRVAVVCLDCAQRAGSLLLGIAILLGVFYGSHGAGSPREPAAPRGFGFQEGGRDMRIFLREPEDSESANLALHNPSGEEVLRANYHKVSGMTYVLTGTPGLQTSLWVSPSGRLFFCAANRNGATELDSWVEQDGRVVVEVKSKAVRGSGPPDRGGDGAGSEDSGEVPLRRTAR